MESGQVNLMGKNTIGTFGRIVAEYLQLPNPESYTGHVWRRSFGTEFANSGATMLQLKRAGRWKSDSVASGYVDTSDHVKKETANALIPKENLPPQALKRTFEAGPVPPPKRARVMDVDKEFSGEDLERLLSFNNCSISGSVSVNVTQKI